MPRTVRKDKHLAPGIKGDGPRVRVTGVLSYPNGVAEFDALMTEDEQEQLSRLFAGVADRVHDLLLDSNRRRRSHSIQNFR